MTAVKMVGEPLPRIPWQDRPRGEDGVLWRHSANPIIGRNPTPRTARVFNSAVVAYNGAFAGVFRADHRNSRPFLHAGFSDDGLTWRIEDADIDWRDEAGQPFPTTYAYDPRVLRLDGAYYICWCTDFGGPAIGLGRTTDFREFVRLENATIPFNRNGVLFPRKINGKYVLLSRPSDSGHTPFGDIYVSESPDLVHWGRHRRLMGAGGSGWWQATKIGAGPVPIETSEGWLLFYHGVTTTCNGFVYSFGAALLDLDEPSRVLARTVDYLLTPERDYETTGFVPNVAFPCATLTDPPTGRIAIYYGAADTYTAVAYGYVDEIVDFIRTHNELGRGDSEIIR